MFEVIKSGNIAKVKEAIAGCKDLNERDAKYSSMPIHYAAIVGNREILRLLAEAGADVNAVNASGKTALHYAAKCGHAGCVEELLERGAAVGAKNNDGNTALFSAANRGHAECVRVLLEHGAAACPEDCLPAVLCAVRRGSAPITAAIVNAVAPAERPRLFAATGAFCDAFAECRNAGAVAAVLGAGFPLRVAPAAAEGEEKKAEDEPPVDVLDLLKFEAVPPVRRPEHARCCLAKSLGALLGGDACGVKPDFTLACGGAGDGAGVAVHRAIAAARCPAVRARLAEAPEAAELAVGASRTAVGWLAEWMYTGAIREFSPDGGVPSPEQTCDLCALLRCCCALYAPQCTDEARDQTPLGLVAALLCAVPIDGAFLDLVWPTVFGSEQSVCGAEALARRLFEHVLRAGTDAQRAALKALPVPVLCTAMRGLRLAARPIAKSVSSAPAAAATPAASSSSMTETASSPKAGEGLQQPEIAPQCPEALRETILRNTAALGAEVLSQELSSAHMTLCRKMYNSINRNAKAAWFRSPVDEERDGAPGYYSLVKNPMDLSTFRKRFIDGHAQSVRAGAVPTVADFVNTGRRIWQNAFIYNRSGTEVFDASVLLAEQWETVLMKCPWPGYSGKGAAPAGAAAGSPSDAAPRAAPAPEKRPSDVPVVKLEQTLLAERIERLQEEGNQAAMVELLRIVGISQNSGEVTLDLETLAPDVIHRMSEYLDTLSLAEK